MKGRIDLIYQEIVFQDYILELIIVEAKDLLNYYNLNLRWMLICILSELIMKI